MIQTRSESNGLQYCMSIKEAFDEAKRDHTIWKISFNAEDGSRVRLVLRESPECTIDTWCYEPLLAELEK